MNRRIFKYEIPAYGGKVRIHGGLNASFLSVANQDGKAVCWVDCDTDQPSEEVEFIAVPTGERPPPQSSTKFLATTFFGPLVWHVYLNIEKPIARDSIVETASVTVLTTDSLPPTEPSGLLGPLAGGDIEEFDPPRWPPNPGRRQ